MGAHMEGVFAFDSSQPSELHNRSYFALISYGKRGEFVA